MFCFVIQVQLPLLYTVWSNADSEIGPEVRCDLSRLFAWKRLQSTFTIANKLRWITQYRRRRTRTHLKISFTWHSRSPVLKYSMDELMLLRIRWNNHTTVCQVLEEKVTSKLLTTQQLHCRLGVFHNDSCCFWNTNDDNTVILITASKRMKGSK